MAVHTRNATPLGSRSFVCLEGFDVMICQWLLARTAARTMTNKRVLSPEYKYTSMKWVEMSGCWAGEWKDETDSRLNMNNAYFPHTHTHTHQKRARRFAIVLLMFLNLSVLFSSFLF